MPRPGAGPRAGAGLAAHAGPTPTRRRAAVRRALAQLVRLSVLLVHDVGTAEEIVQDAFVAMHGRWSRLREPEHALAYLRQAVVNRSRSALRHRKVADRHLTRERGLATLTAPGADRATLEAAQRTAVLDGMRQRRTPARGARSALLPRPLRGRDRDPLGISTGAVKSHASRGAAALRTHLEDLRWERRARRPQPSPVRRRGPDRAALGHRGDPLPHRTHKESPMATPPCAARSAPPPQRQP